MTKQELLRLLKDFNQKATPAPWKGYANHPFYAVLEKPAHSLSKHDRERPHYWRIEDVELLLLLRNNVSDIIKFLEET